MKRANTKNRLYNESPFCFVCKRMIQTQSEATLEHIIPKSKGGSNKKSNLALSHQFCNQLKDNFLSPSDWEKKLNLYENDISFILRRRIDKLESEIALLNFTIKGLELQNEEEYMPQKKLILTLRGKKNLSFLIETSKYLHHYRVQHLWELIFGVLFLENFRKTQEILAFLHSIWRFQRFITANNHHPLVPFALQLLEECKELNLVAYEKLIK